MTIIEQADSIVGITDEIGACRNYGLSRDIYRRGAYLGWLANQEEEKCGDECRKRDAYKHRIGSVPIEMMAEVVVAVHAATRPKGDGLPDNLTVLCSYVDGNECVKVSHSDDRTMSFVDQVATAAYLTRCLSAPVRRLMAAFEVTYDPPPDLKAENIALRATLDGKMLRSGEVTKLGNVICWLVPKAVKR